MVLVFVIASLRKVLLRMRTAEAKAAAFVHAAARLISADPLC
jgi:hypothetical protein